MKNRTIENYATTLLGVFVLSFCAIMIWTDRGTFESVSGWVAMGLMFLRSKDSLIGLKAK